MSNDNFSTELYTAIEQKISWFDSVYLPKLQDEYRKLDNHVVNVSSILQKKGAVSPDPYKMDKKISEIILPPETNYVESERAMVIGTRLSDFESMINFICSYFSFNVLNFDVDTIKKLVALNGVFQWGSLSINSGNTNTKGLAVIVNTVKQSNDSLSSNVLSDGISQISKTINNINSMLKEVMEFQKELYKSDVRKSIFEHPKFDYAAAKRSEKEALQQIRKLFPSVMGKRAFYTELIEDIIREEFSPSKDICQQNLLKKLEVPKETLKIEQVEVNTKSVILDVISSLSSLVPQFDVVIRKVEDNKNVLELQRSSIWTNFRRLLRRAFGFPEKEIIYKLAVAEAGTQIIKTEELHYGEFISTFTKRSRLYASFASKKSESFMKVSKKTEEQLLEFLSAQVSESQKTLAVLSALDEYFKKNISTAKKQSVRGLKIELLAIKNALLKINQKRADYISLIEEQHQFKKLGL